jgi:hypothetical protein
LRAKRASLTYSGKEERDCEAKPIADLAGLKEEDTP